MNDMEVDDDDWLYSCRLAIMKASTMPTNYSSELTVLTKTMLNEDPDQRPTVDDILGQQVMKNALIVFSSQHTKFYR